MHQLPRDVSEALLAQQSKGRLNTVCTNPTYLFLAFNAVLQPLHIAVKLGYIRPVKLIVEFTKSTILMPDVGGQTTLHIAVKACYPKITSILLAAADPKGLQMENSVGNTLLDIASLGELGSRIHRLSQSQGNSINELGVINVEAFHRYPEAYIQKMDKELPKLHAILDTLFADGRLKSHTKIATELTKFASMMGERLSAAKVARVPEKEVEVENKNLQDSHDVETTFSIVLAALKDLTVNRQLVHLIDVQRSVGADLEKVRRKRLPGHSKDEDKMGPEQDENEEKGRSMVWGYVGNIPTDSI